MSHRVALRKRKNYSRLAPRLAVSVIVLSLFAAATSAIARNNENHHVRIVTLSTRPDTVSGGDVLVEIDVPGRVELQDVKVTLNGQDITNAFRPNPNGQRALLGLVEGLRLGENRLIAHANGGGSDELTLTNYPITGPIFSGPHETPFICMTNAFRVPTPSTAGGATLGVPLDANCSIATRVDYIYRTTAGAYKLLPNPPIHPTDLAQTTTTLGRTVPYIVRIETGRLTARSTRRRSCTIPRRSRRRVRSIHRRRGIIAWSTRSAGGASAAGTSKAAASVAGSATAWRRI